MPAAGDEAKRCVLNAVQLLLLADLASERACEIRSGARSCRGVLQGLFSKRLKDLLGNRDVLVEEFEKIERRRKEVDQSLWERVSIEIHSARDYRRPLIASRPAQANIRVRIAEKPQNAQSGKVGKWICAVEAGEMDSVHSSPPIFISDALAFQSASRKTAS
ncbi:MAG: hypothetical protein JWQ87_1530 [Candidatus Sulfotelmatobacter sp.]|nr:hypothetical protein [Candidatus Sulfotelmatobacter sp.]